MDLAGKVIGCAIEVHKQLGPGLLESAYQTCLLYELRKKNIQAHSEIMCSIDYKGLRLDAGYRIDLLVE
jgi:GxxExxY protein